MPRAPRVRHGDTNASDRPGGRRAWLSHLKEEAVRQLPASASPSDRATLRSAVERSLRGHGPDDPAPEIQDIVATLLTETFGGLEQARLQAERAERKAALIAMGEVALALLVQRCPVHLVGTLGSHQRIQITRTLWHDLRATLTQSLSGGEAEEEVIQVVDAHVTAWRLAHERRWRPRLPSPAQVSKVIDATARIVEAAGQEPALRELARTVSQAVLDRLRRGGAPKDPPPASS